MTVTCGFVGTMAYGAPEQMGGEVDHRTDIYALGATLYCMLTGRPPYGGTALDVLQQHRDASLPTAPLEGLPDAVVNPIRRCMEKVPVDRYQSAGDLAGALERAREAFARVQAAAPAPAPAPAPTPEDARPTAALPGAAPLVPDAAPAETVPLTPPPPAAPTVAAPPTPPPAAAEPTVAAPPPQPPAAAEPTVEATPTPPPAAAEPTVAAPPTPPPAPSPEDAPAAAAALRTAPIVPDAVAGEAVQSTSAEPAQEPSPAGTPPTSPVAAQTPPPSPPSGGQISMTRQPRGRRSRLSAAVFDLEIRNDGLDPVQVDLSAVDPDGALRFDLPERAHVPAGGTTVVQLRARGRRRRWLGPVLPVAFSADGTPPGGGPPASVTGSFADAPLGWPILGGGVLGVGAVLAAAAAGLFLAMGGGGDNGGNGLPPVAPATETVETETVEGSATAQAGDATMTATPTRARRPRAALPRRLPLLPQPRRQGPRTPPPPRPRARPPRHNRPRPLPPPASRWRPRRRPRHAAGDHRGRVVLRLPRHREHVPLRCGRERFLHGFVHLVGGGGLRTASSRSARPWTSCNSGPVCRSAASPSATPSSSGPFRSSPAAPRGWRCSRTVLRFRERDGCAHGALHLPVRR